MVPVEGAAGGQEVAELLRVKVRRRSRPKIRSGLMGGLGASTSRTGLVGIRRSRRAASRMRSRIDRHAITPLWLRLPSRSFCQRSTMEGVIWRSCRRPKVGRRWQRRWLSVVSMPLGLRRGLEAQSCHQWLAHSSNRMRPRRGSVQESAATWASSSFLKSRARLRVWKVLAPWVPSSNRHQTL
jgi:hypothetical protein